MEMKPVKQRFEEIVAFIKLASFIFLVVLQGLNIALPISYIFFHVGVIPVNIVLASISAVLLSFTIIRHIQESKKLKSVEKLVQKICRIIKIFAKAVSLGVSIYGIVMIINDVNWFSVVVVILSLLLWIAQVMLEVVRSILEKQIAKLASDIKQEYDKVLILKDKVGNFVRCAAGSTGADESKVTEREQKAIDAIQQGRQAARRVKDKITGTDAE